MKKIWTLISNFLFRKPEINQETDLPTPTPKPAADKSASQSQIIGNALIQKGTISVKEMEKDGIHFTIKAVCLLRKKGWHIKTQLLVVNGRKEDIFYILQEQPNLPIA